LQEEASQENETAWIGRAVFLFQIYFSFNFNFNFSFNFN